MVAWEVHQNCTKNYCNLGSHRILRTVFDSYEALGVLVGPSLTRSPRAGGLQLNMEMTMVTSRNSWKGTHSMMTQRGNVSQCLYLCQTIASLTILVSAWYFKKGTVAYSFIDRTWNFPNKDLQMFIMSSYEFDFNGPDETLWYNGQTY